MTTRCTRCILPENFQRISFDEQGVCSYCKSYRPFIPRDEKIILDQFQRAKNKVRPYDAIVPLSGGKDSTYVLYLARVK
jgi:3'-phosphoadenosine 5'-phosphosulfate sulfotransferase (PAPS reductase)/FAD synthetase